MASTQAMVTSFKVELLKGVHDFTAITGDTFKLALYTSSASLDKDTTIYTTTGEVSGTNYSAGGGTLVAVTPVSGGSTTAFVNFADFTFSNVTLTDVRYALIYNSSQSDKAVCVLDFGSGLTRTAKDLVIKFPAASETSAILRIA